MPRPPQVSPTTATLSSSVYSALVRKARERFAGPLAPLHVGDTWREPPMQARAESQHTSVYPRLHNYAPVHGEPTLLDAIAERLERRGGRPVPRERIQVTAGGTGAFACVASALLDPGDEVLLLSPFWPLIRGIVAARGAAAVQVPFHDRLEQPGFDPVRALEAARTERTVAVYLNSPNNPTGRITPPDVVDEVVAFARRHDLWLITDEAYEDLWLTDAPPEPLWARPDVQERLVAVHTVSKSYGLAGARVGWVHGAEAAMKAISGVQTYLTYCAPRPMQVGAARALREADDWPAEARAQYREAAALAAECFGLEPPEGGTFLFFDARPWLPEDATDAMPFLERCALEAGVLMTPGAACGADYPTWVRMCFTAVPPDELNAALGRLKPLLKEMRR